MIYTYGELSHNYWGKIVYFRSIGRLMSSLTETNDYDIDIVNDNRLYHSYIISYMIRSPDH